MAWFSPVLGTTLVTRYGPGDDEDVLDALVLAEIARLDDVFSLHHSSELTRYNAGSDAAGADLAAVLDAAARWRAASGGAFDAGARPRVDLNAIAKGYIADRAVAVALAAGAGGVLVNLGGDLVHAGPQPVMVAIEDPATPWDNAAPLTRVPLRDAALATSGTAHRGRHLVDPRTGRPAEGVLQASVIAADACSADALATAVFVLGPDAGRALVEQSGAACLVVGRDGVVASASWPGRRA